MCTAYLISASYDKQIRFWDGASGRTVRCFSFQDSQVNALLLIPGTSYLAVAGFGVVRVYDIGAANAACGNGAGAGSQVPPLFSSYENQSAMNITSLGSFPLHTVRGASGLSDFSREESNNSLFNATVELQTNQRVSVDVNLSELSHVLFATSEDGHIRFFKTTTTNNNSLFLIKDIATGAAITCSAVSPNYETLLTGSQIGRVSVWHLPTIISVVTQGVENSKHALFGDAPLQEIAFDTDYTAIRSIAIEPLARWSVVATNAGKLHFLRFMKSSPHGRADSPGRGGINLGDLPSNLAETTAEHSVGETIPDEPFDATIESGTRHIRCPNFLHSEGVYRSALVSSEQRNNALRGNALGSSFADHTKGSHAVALSGSPDSSSFHQSAQSLSRFDAIPNSNLPPPSEPDSIFQQKFMMEVFFSFQAHYKYILKVAISPNTDFLVTCSADYTVGRFLIPLELQKCSVSGDEQGDETASRGCGSDSEMSVTAPLDPETMECSPTKSQQQEKPLKEGVEEAKAASPLFMLPQPTRKGSKQASLPEPQKQLQHTADSKTVDLMNKDDTKAIVGSLVHSTASETKVGDKMVAFPSETHDASSQLFSVIPSLSVDGNPQSQHPSVLQFKALKPLTGHMRWVWDCVFSDCGRFLFTASSDHYLRMWTGLLSDRVHSTCCVGHTKPVVCCILYYERRRQG